MALSIEKTKIDGLFVIHPHVFEDQRGYFLKDYERSFYIKNGLPTEFFEISESQSKKGTLRGLHFQKKYPQGLFIRALKGSAFVVAVDLRFKSSTFGQWLGFELSESNHMVFYIPEGFAHGLLALDVNNIVSFKSTSKYAPEYETGIIFNDPDIGVEWPIDKVGGWSQMVISSKDLDLPSFNEFVLKTI